MYPIVSDLAALIASLISSTETFLSSSNVKSTTDPVSVGTLRAFPSSFPFISGITLAGYLVLNKTDNEIKPLISNLINNNNLPKTFDCVYSTKYKLSDIAKTINNLSNYKVDVNILDKNLGLSYCGKNTDLGLAFDGLECGIKELYRIISKEI